MSARNAIIWWGLVVCLVSVGIGYAEVLPGGSAPPALDFKHFPDRLHAFVWRNWEMVSLERMGQVLGTTPENVEKMGRSMGLPRHVRPPAVYQQRGYISIIRRNWHLLPYDQLLTLLEWDAQKLAFTLREDDFLWVKLGSLKPACPSLRYNEPDEPTRRRCAEIKALVETHFGNELEQPARPRFDFLRDMSPVEGHKTPMSPPSDREEPIRFLYSYFGVFGDPLLDAQLDPYPDELLSRLSESGVTGVWLHVVLRQLAPSSIFPEFGVGSEQRLATLRKMVERAGRYGVKIYLYMNEPRAMPAAFFESRADIRGVQEGDHFALCSSASQVRQWLTDSLQHVFEQVPGLGGVFTITASENLTNCYSHRRDAGGCPRCSKRPGPEVIAEVNRAIAEGVWAGDSRAKVIVWDWGWPDGTGAGWGQPDWASQIIAALPDGVQLMCVSEWGKPITRGGVAGAVGEYSISTVGPGPRAGRHWALTQERGLRTLAKVQVNCSWELSAVPFIPAMDLVARHCDNLAKAGVDGLMLSWTVGGYPSANLELVSKFQRQPTPTVTEALNELAEDRYGAAAVREIRAAWSLFSDAFAEYPFHGAYVYRGPTQYGPANLLYAEPSGYRSTMVGFPYDDLDGWRAIYPADVLAGQFETMAATWRKALSTFAAAIDRTQTPLQRVLAQSDYGVAEAAGLHFDSVARQIHFIQARTALRSASLDSAGHARELAVLRTAIDAEIQNVRRLFTLTRNDPRIGFEASNHYYYLPLDLVEKVVNCEHIRSVWLPRQVPSQSRP